jgi:hypothetical protein
MLISTPATSAITIQPSKSYYISGGGSMERLGKESLRKEKLGKTQKDFWPQPESLRKERLGKERLRSERLGKTLDPNRNSERKDSERKDSERLLASTGITSKGNTQIGKTQKDFVEIIANCDKL